MSEIILDTSNEISLNWSASGTDRIIQNVYNIVNTFKYEVAYNRNLGMSPEIIDCDINKVKGIITEDLIENINKYEPRATVKSLEVKEITSTGDIAAIIKLEI